MADFRWGIIGPGRIARKFATSLPFSKNGILYAVASTHGERAADFAAEFGAERSFFSYGEMLNEARPDAVYIATPHPFHFEPAMLAIEAGIPVLCEKPMTDGYADTKKLVSCAREKGVFLMEGLWSWFLPHMQQVKSWIESGEIGRPVHIQADFGYKAMRNIEGRQFNPVLGGGVTKDIAIYPLALFCKLFGPPESMQVLGSRASETGVDEHVIFQGKLNGGLGFQGMVSFVADTETRAFIYGTEGRIEFSKQWFRAVSATLNRGNESKTISCPTDGFGFQFEADEVEACVRMGLKESQVWSLDDSLLMAEWIQKIESGI